MQSSEPPYVSVLLVTFNHERYIAEAIGSVMAQDAPFPFEVVVSDDHSTDSTADVIRACAERYPGRIRPFFNSHNLGTARNFLQTLQECRGRYVALLDGDDFWLSPAKLRRQVELLDRHPGIAICCGRARVFYEDGQKEPWEYPISNRTIFTIQDLIRENLIPTCTSVFRLGLLLDIPEWLSSLKFTDWALHTLLAQYGDIALLPETLAAYRVHNSGVASSMSPEQTDANRIAFHDAIRSHLGSRYTTPIDPHQG